MSTDPEDVRRELERLNAIAEEHGDFLVVRLPEGAQAGTFHALKLTRRGDAVELEFLPGERYFCNLEKLKRALDAL
jgi:hypothetical protein